MPLLADMTLTFLILSSTVVQIILSKSIIAVQKFKHDSKNGDHGSGDTGSGLGVAVEPALIGSELLV